jgi:hypothetical protein
MQIRCDRCGKDRMLAEHLEMPQRFTGESLRSVRIVDPHHPCMASAFRSATDGLGEDRR